MTNYCLCTVRKIDRSFLKAGLVYCSVCDSPVCCDAIDMETEGGAAHPAEVVS